MSWFYESSQLGTLWVSSSPLPNSQQHCRFPKHWIQNFTSVKTSSNDPTFPRKNKKLKFQDWQVLKFIQLSRITSSYKTQNPICNTINNFETDFLLTSIKYQHSTMHTSRKMWIKTFPHQQDLLIFLPKSYSSLYQQKWHNQVKHALESGKFLRLIKPLKSQNTQSPSPKKF